VATIGEILDEFFSPLGRERLWVMPETDNYTKIVRSWKPVIDAVAQAKADLAANCATWSGGRQTTPTWRPGMTDPPITDPNALRVFKKSPSGTDPATCMAAFAVYLEAKAIRLMSRLPLPMVPLPLPEGQTFQLYTCSIGSFNIFATADRVDCAAGTATMNVWMFNCMSRDSFGRFARLNAFKVSKMANQYMWWNWKEAHRWGPAAAPSGTWSVGGPSRW
jgi:hypothetical protein